MRSRGSRGEEVAVAVMEVVVKRAISIGPSKMMATSYTISFFLSLGVVHHGMGL